MTDDRSPLLLNSVHGGIDLSRFSEIEDRLRSSLGMDVLSEHLGLVARELGFPFHALVEHADLTDRPPGLIFLQNYPVRWAETYVKAGLHRHDPTRRLVRQGPRSFAWRELHALLSLSDAERRMLDDAGKAGLGEGFTVPLYVPGQRAASCSFATETGQPLPVGALGMARLLAQAAFEALFYLRHPGGLPRAPHLSRQQLRCVELASQGKSDKQIGRELGLAPSTVTTYLKSGRGNLGVCRRGQLGLAAVDYGLLSLDELRTWTIPI
ncbi:helix-turn-helix transcriptional regulator [Novosphingobium sp. JCM 18896]|uniref:helix-turn-helix transcriptional regulator n=1 Tax=Novosphingobium sp. JCM 18896 TaxID=2989731 RepID=UPI0022227F39|nr:LuxR family transcriptional regulator [Novosphingobium sp. JCM 18896]MCW1429354.1 LuxR family transcriptional regulator [Novosphingobium sp. JCM 18896]